MRYYAFVNRLGQSGWVDDTPFLLWEIGMKTVVEHWADTLYATNQRMILWLEEVDPRVITFVNEMFPLCRNVTIRIGVPTGDAESCTYIDSGGQVVITPGAPLTKYLPDQPAVTTWFNMVNLWLSRLANLGSGTPELESEIRPGVFVGHHSRISPKAELVGPCWIGAGSTVGAARIGPNAIVGEGCVISAGAAIAESYVLRDTFIGEGLSLHELVAGHGNFLHHRRGILAPIHDDTLSRSLVG
jgi:acetyltransferase-like isoleucine patch superfamily enzyme